MDVTERVGGDWDAALNLASKLQRRVMDSVNLSASFGIGPTRILAKMAGEENKPKGIFRILPVDILDFFESRSPREVPGIGPKIEVLYNRLIGNKLIHLLCFKKCYCM